MHLLKRPFGNIDINTLEETHKYMQNRASVFLERKQDSEAKHYVFVELSLLFLEPGDLHKTTYFTGPEVCFQFSRLTFFPKNVQKMIPKLDTRKSFLKK